MFKPNPLTSNQKFVLYLFVLIVASTFTPLFSAPIVRFIVTIAVVLALSIPVLFVLALVIVFVFCFVRPAKVQPFAVERITAMKAIVEAIRPARR